MKFVPNKYCNTKNSYPTEGNAASLFQYFTRKQLFFKY